MRNPLDWLLDIAPFSPRWRCGQWETWEGWAQISAEAAVFGAYSVIPLILLGLHQRMPKNLRILGWVFAAFIVSCGLTHLTDAFMWWHPVYRVRGLLLIMTALFSWAAVWLLGSKISYIRLFQTPEEMLDQLHRRAASEQAAQQSAARLTAILDSPLTAIVVANDLLIITEFNAAAQRLFGCYRSQAIGQPVELFVPRAALGAFRAGVERYRAVGASHLFGRVNELTAVDYNGRELAIEISLTGWEDADANRFYTASIRDVSDRSRLLQTLRENQKSLETQLRQRNLLERELDALRSLQTQHSSQITDTTKAILELKEIANRLTLLSNGREHDDHGTSGS